MGINRDAVPPWPQPCLSPHPVRGQLAAVGDQHVVEPHQERFSLNEDTGTADAATGDDAVMLISV